MPFRKPRRTRSASDLISLGLQTGGERSTKKAPSRIGVVMLSVIVTVVVAIAGIASWRSNTAGYRRNPSGAMVMFSPTPPAMPANAPSKEYIYAGSSLISTVEPFRQPSMDVATWRPSDATWHIMNSQGQEVVTQWGQAGDVLVPGDYDGDGKTDCAIYRPSDNGWYILNSSNGSLQNATWGTSGDIMVPADFDGDGKSDVALWRPSTQNWYMLQSSNGSVVTAFGSSGDVPIPADYDGDGKSDLAVWRSSNATFYVKRSTDGQTVSQALGLSTDTPVTGDFDGDGKADFAIREGDSWIIKSSSTGNTTTYTFASSRDSAAVGRYNDSADSDTISDIAAVRRNRGSESAMTWLIRRSSDGTTRTLTFGQSGDTPVPAAWKR